MLWGFFSMSETSGFPPQPEPPELIQYWRWFVGYFAREGKVIKEAKVTFGTAAFVLVAVSVLATWKGSSSFFEERIVVLEKTIDYQKTQIDDLRNRVQAVAPTPPPALAHAQIIPVILKLFPSTPESKRPFVNFGFMNFSAIPARGPTAKGYMKVFDKILTAEEEDKIILDLKAEANQANPILATNQMTYGEYTYYSAFNKEEGDDEKLDAVKEGKKYLYVFFVGQFTDDNQPKDEKYVMERCAIYFSSLDVNGTCHGHNQTYAEKMK
jgi:hypothetical protein